MSSERSITTPSRPTFTVVLNNAIEDPLDQLVCNDDYERAMDQIIAELPRLHEVAPTAWCPLGRPRSLPLYYALIPWCGVTVCYVQIGYALHVVSIEATADGPFDVILG